MFLKVVLLFFISLFIVDVNAGPIVKREDLISMLASMIRSQQKMPIMHKDSGVNNNNDVSLQPIMSLVTDDDTAQVNMDPSSHHHSFYVDGHRSKSNLNYGVTNIGSRQHRYGEGTWRPNPDQTQQQQEKSNNNKSAPRRKENSLNSMDDQRHVFNSAPPPPPPSSIKESDDTRRKKEEKEKDVVALDNHGQLHTLALPMTILPLL